MDGRHTFWFISGRTAITIESESNATIVELFPTPPVVANRLGFTHPRA